MHEQQKKVPHFTVNGVAYDLVATSEWTFAEALKAKSVSGGMAVGTIEERVGVGDPDALLAAMIVSIHRVNPNVTVEHLLEAKLVAFFDDLNASSKNPDPEEDEPESPPAVAAPSSVESGENSITPTTREPAGIRSS